MTKNKVLKVWEKWSKLSHTCKHVFLIENEEIIFAFIQ
jgi:hypothetical protein